jgi:transcriptional regulator GlxA family with amidase domain
MIDVLFVMLPSTVLLDLAGPAEAFRIANQSLGREAFRLRFVGPEAQLKSSVGIGLSGIEPLPRVIDANFEQTWVVLMGLPGKVSAQVLRQPAWHKTRAWLTRSIAPALFESGQTRLKLLTVCVGAVLAADAGLLAHRRCTTHHELLDTLAQLAPTATVISNRVFVEDGPIFSSAGITAGIDLALHLIATQCGSAMASTVAQVMVAFTRRGPLDQLQSPLLKFRDHIHPAVHRIQDAICADPQRAWSAQEMASIGCVTPRHVTRLFAQFVGETPRDYLESVRLSIAKHAQGRGASPARAAQVSGLQSVRRLRDSRHRQPNR